jgi:hypothetical protein
MGRIRESDTALLRSSSTAEMRAPSTVIVSRISRQALESPTRIFDASSHLAIYRKAC